MKIEILNREILSWPKSHPARRFLEAFVACRRECVGSEVEYAGSSRKAVNHEWRSSIDGQMWSFSRFAYTFISFDIVLDGWLTNAPEMTPSEQANLRQIPQLRRLMQECAHSAAQSNKDEIVVMAKRMLEMLELWELAITERPRVPRSS